MNITDPRPFFFPAAGALSGALGTAFPGDVVGSALGEALGVGGGLAAALAAEGVAGRTLDAAFTVDAVALGCAGALAIAIEAFCSEDPAAALGSGTLSSASEELPELELDEEDPEPLATHSSVPRLTPRPCVKIVSPCPGVCL